MGRAFLIIYRIFYRSRPAYVVFLLLLLAFIAFFGSGIRFEEDINKLIPASDKNDRLLRVLEHSSFADRMVICLSWNGEGDTDPLRLIAYANDLIDSLRSPLTQDLISRIEAKVMPDDARSLYDVFHDQLPLFLDSNDYHIIQGRISDSAVAGAIKSAYESLLSPGGFALRDYILKDPLSLTPLAMEKLERLNISENFELFDDYIVSRDKKNLLFFLVPANPATETAENGILLKAIDRYNSKLYRHYGQTIDMRYFGSMAVSGSNASQIKKDILLTVSIALVLLLLLLGLYFRKALRLMMLFIPAILGGGMAVAMIAILKGEVSAISLGLGSVMLGISIDYALHFLSHLGRSRSVKTVIRDISNPVMISSLTTASAFLCLMVLKSEAMQDLGLFAALSVFFSAVFTLVILPPLFRHETIVEPEGRQSAIHSWLSGIASYGFHKNKRIKWAIFLLLIFFSITAGRVRFEGNMDHMSYMRPELIHSENYLDSISDYKLKTMFVVSGAGSLDQALAGNESIIPRIEALKQAGIVHAYTSVHPYFPSSGEGERRIQAWKDFWEWYPKEDLAANIRKASSGYGFKENAFREFYALLDYEKEADNEKLALLRTSFLNEYLYEGDSLAMVTCLLKVKQENKPLVYSALEGIDNILVFDRQSLTSSFMDSLHDSFNTLILVSLLVVFLILTLSFGRIELGIITFIPLLISWAFTLGIMGMLGIRFNIFNVVISTFIFGLGIDYAIFTMRGLMQEYQHGYNKLDSYKTAILLSGITTLAGIGVLVFAKHPALQSIAISAIIGIASVIIITYTILPGLFRFLIKHEGRDRKWPVTLKDFIFSVNTLMIFLVGVIILDLIILILRYLIPLPVKQKKLFFHKVLSIATWTIVYGSVNIRKTIHNRSGEDFKKPAIVICNHQSHLDTVLSIMQNPRMILLTNPWIQRSIFYKGFIRFVDFYSVDEGNESLSKKIRAIVNDGYSILYFPEGTRSPRLEIGRFHQGAFHMARELGLDILPIVSYGSGNAMPKFEPFLKTSPVSMTILPRIEPGNPLIKETPLATAKAVRKYFKKEYAVIRKKAETPEFFRKKVIRNYLYRGPVLEWYMKVKIRLDDHYRLFDRYLPKSGAITDIGCGYGFMAYMLHLMAPEREITAYDYDAEKISTASHCALKNKNISFVHADITELDLCRSDAFVLSDVLHYLPAEEQEILIRNCIGQLNPGGVMIIREADTGMKKKHLGTRISEFLSTGTGFNMTRGNEKKLYFSTADAYLKIFSEYDVEVSTIDRTRMNSNLVYIIKKPGDEI